MLFKSITLVLIVLFVTTVAHSKSHDDNDGADPAAEDEQGVC